MNIIVKAILFYLTCGITVSAFHRYVCREGFEELDEEFREDLGVKQCTLEVMLFLIGVSVWPLLIKEILTWNQDE